MAGRSERGFAAEDHGRPGHADGVGAAEAGNWWPWRCRSPPGRRPPGTSAAGTPRAAALITASSAGTQATATPRTWGGYGVPRPLHQRQVEHHQAGHRDPGQPQPLRAARPCSRPAAGEVGERHEDQAGPAVPHRLGGEDRRPSEHRGRLADACRPRRPWPWPPRPRRPPQRGARPTAPGAVQWEAWRAARGAGRRERREREDQARRYGMSPTGPVEQGQIKGGGFQPSSQHWPLMAGMVSALTDDGAG